MIRCIFLRGKRIACFVVRLSALSYLFVSHCESNCGFAFDVAWESVCGSQASSRRRRRCPTSVDRPTLPMPGVTRPAVSRVARAPVTPRSARATLPMPGVTRLAISGVTGAPVTPRSAGAPMALRTVSGVTRAPLLCGQPAWTAPLAASGVTRYPAARAR